MRNMFDVSGKVVLVTGGGRGIGKMIAQGFAQNGAVVYIASRDAARLAQAAEELSQNGGRCTGIAADLSTLDGAEALAKQIQEREGRLDVLVNNAGSVTGAPIDFFTQAMWDQVMDVNAKAVFFTTQKMLPLLRAAASADAPARVVNISSVAGLRAPPFEAFSYSASKAACISLTYHLASRLAAEHILVNAIAPGPFATDMMAPRLAAAGDEVRDGNPLKRLGTAEDIAGCALFLASRASAYTTGAVIPCDGGLARIG